MLRDYQQTAVKLAKQAVLARRNCLLVSPTGTGKSYMMIAAHQQLAYSGMILTPSVDIIEGFNRKGVDTNISTPLKFLNQLRKGIVKPLPEYLFVDEAHHSIAETYKEIYTCLPVPIVGFTATPYRGQHKQNTEFLNLFDEVHTVLTWQKAIADGYLSLPLVETIPLVDDDLLKISRGEFCIEELTADTNDKMLTGLHELQERNFFSHPVMRCITLPSVASMVYCAKLLTEELNYRCAIVQGSTSRAERDEAITKARSGEVTLLQCKILREGVDLPIRLLADFSPTLSPVQFLQHFGRACRPAKAFAPKYYCFNRNIQNHGYLLADILPPLTQRQALEAYPTRPARNLYRFPGIETFGRIKPATVFRANGEPLLLYIVQSISDKTRQQHACLIDPSKPEPYWFTRDLPDGKWAMCNAPTELQATGSINRTSPLSEKQIDWFRKQAHRYGLMAEQELDQRVFQLLPILYNCNLRLSDG